MGTPTRARSSSKSSSSKRGRKNSVRARAAKEKDANAEKPEKTAQSTMKTITALGDVFSAEAKETMKKFVEQIAQGGVHALRLQYLELKFFMPPENARTSSEANTSKCRYKDVGCLDKTRVVLKWPPEVKGDFVHANWVHHKLLDNAFICCQGPMDGTVSDFWRMVWQEHVKLIIMLCRCEELGKEKCALYWPVNKDESRTYFGLNVKNEKIDSSDPSFVTTRLLLTYKDEHRHVDHRQWTKCVPKTPMAPFRLLQYSRKYTKNPTIVHCSAGIGRTGTLVMIEMAYRSLVQAKMPDIMELTKDLRSQRAQAIQTEDQFVYVHYALMQLMFIKTVVPQHAVRTFCKEYEKYLQLLNENGGKQLGMEATAVPFAVSPVPKKGGSVRERKKKDDTTTEDSVRKRKKLRINRTVGDSRRERSVVPAHTKEKEPPAKDEKRSDGVGTSTGRTSTSPSPSPLPSATLVSTRSVNAAAPPAEPAPAPQEAAAASPPIEPEAVLPSFDPPTAREFPKPKFVYTTPKTYTVQTAGGKKTIVYQRSAQPFIKTLAAPQGQQQPQVLVVTNPEQPTTPNNGNQ